MKNTKINLFQFLFTDAFSTQFRSSLNESFQDDDESILL